MRSLEDWISKLLYRDLSELNGQYSSPHYGAAEQDVESLPEVEPPQYAAGRVDTDLLQKMHLKIREQKCARNRERDYISPLGLRTPKTSGCPTRPGAVFGDNGG